jgi:hypothetical protein
LVCATPFAVARHIFVGEPEAYQIVHGGICLNVNVSALSAVTAVGTASGLALVCLEGVHSVSPVTRFNGYSYPVGKLVFIYHICSYVSPVIKVIINIPHIFPAGGTIFILGSKQREFIQPCLLP